MEKTISSLLVCALSAQAAVASDPLRTIFENIEVVSGISALHLSPNGGQDRSSRQDPVEESRERWKKQIESLERLLLKTEDTAIQVEIRKLLDSAQKSLDEINAAIEKKQKAAERASEKDPAFEKVIKMSEALRRLILLHLEFHGNGYYYLHVREKKEAALDIAGIENEYKALTERLPFLKKGSVCRDGMAYVNIIVSVSEGAEEHYRLLRQEFQASLLKALQMKKSDPGLVELASWGISTQVQNEYRSDPSQRKVPVLDASLHDRFSEAKGIAQNKEKAAKDKVKAQWNPPQNASLKWNLLQSSRLQYKSREAAAWEAESLRQYLSNSYSQYRYLKYEVVTKTLPGITYKDPGGYESYDPPQTWHGYAIYGAE
jgi:hypothetical protein